MRKHTPTIHKALVVGGLLFLLAPGAAAGLLSSTPGVSAAPWLAWRTEIADSGDVISAYTTSLALGAETDPIIAYFASDSDGFGSVWVAGTEGQEWQRHLVESKAGPIGLALDPAGVPHVAYSKGNNAGLGYASRIASGWQTELVDSASPSRGTLAFDGQGRPHIVYTTSTSLVKHAVKDGGIWHVETVTSGSTMWVDMALGPDGQPRVAYKTSDQGFRYATRSADGLWTLEVVPEAGCNLGLSVALDKEGSPHVACNALDGLTYLKRDPATGEWTREVVDTGCDGPLICRAGAYVGLEPSLALDQEGRPHISYRYVPHATWPEIAPGQLHYATKLDGEWLIEVVDRIGESNGYGSSLALDAEGHPHISYVLDWWHRSGESVANQKYDLMYAQPLGAVS